MCANPNKLWVQLVRSNYLRGRRLLDYPQTTQSSSQVWSGIRNCFGALRNELCIKVVQNSVSRVYENQWLLGIPKFLMPVEITRRDEITYVRDLMNDARIDWNIAIVRASFP